jgi:hypothetical protein
MATHSEDWISIAKQVSVETDHAKLITLVEQLCCALDDRKEAASNGRRVTSGYASEAE